MAEERVCEASRSPGRDSSETGSAVVATSEPALTIETSNFRQVLLQFDDDGNFIGNKNTRFSIPCDICRSENIGPGNPLLDEPETVPYTVLRCGHAFGQQCLSEWYAAQEDRSDLKCPTCRASVYCQRGHRAVLVIFPRTKDIETQCGQIKAIRKALGSPGCEPCSVETALGMVGHGMVLELPDTNTFW
ncbi:hypothetical protein F5Y10DRAFT_292397 [Nemania abortiva]|nr:hypothetical protein F5Y10DRAFT_292397 [Nemania abortiva]